MSFQKEWLNSCWTILSWRLVICHISGSQLHSIWEKHNWIIWYRIRLLYLSNKQFFFICSRCPHQKFWWLFDSYNYLHFSLYVPSRGLNSRMRILEETLSNYKIANDPTGTVKWLKKTSRFMTLSSLLWFCVWKSSRRLLVCHHLLLPVCSSYFHKRHGSFLKNLYIFLVTFLSCIDRGLVQWIY